MEPATARMLAKVSEKMKQILSDENGNFDMNKVLSLIIGLFIFVVLVPALLLTALTGGYTEVENPVKKAIEEITIEDKVSGNLDFNTVTTILYFTTNGNTTSLVEEELKEFIRKYFITTEVKESSDNTTTDKYFIFNQEVLSLIKTDYKLSDKDIESINLSLNLFSTYGSLSGSFENLPIAGDSIIVTQGYGGTGLDGKKHTGIDLVSATHETSILAFWDGVVVASTYDNVGGYSVVIYHEKKDMYTYYGHLANQGVPVGTVLKAGTEIGTMGSTGLATGDHLHFEIRTKETYGSDIDPTEFIQQKKGG